jgi:hypothetical protein
VRQLDETWGIIDKTWSSYLGHVVSAQDDETNKVRHAQVIQNIWNIVIKSIRTHIHIYTHTYKNE